MAQANTPTNMAEQFQHVLGKRIKDYRRKSGFTQVQLSESVDISRASLANIETGNQRVSTFLLARLAEALDIPPGDLIPDLSDVALQLKQARQTSVPSESESKLMVQELGTFGISVTPKGTLKKALNEVQHTYKKIKDSKKIKGD